MSIWWRQRGRTQQAVYSLSAPIMVLVIVLGLLATIIIYAIS